MMTSQSGLTWYRELHLMDLCGEISQSMGGNHMLMPPAVEQFRTRFVSSFRSFDRAAQNSFSRHFREYLSSIRGAM